MTIGTLVLNIGIAAFIITLVIGFVFKGHKSWLMTFFQNFTGVLFVFSGWVKAIDPLGTAYKMEQYFAEFYTTFEATWFSFLAPIFPLMAEFSIAFSVFMIVFEIVLGIMLLLGAMPKVTAWAFLLLVVFFTVLTGFTFLTGYVPPEGSFFSFSTWGGYNPNNMKVTDCGCFGDFIKLEPRISFYKDLVLLVPSFYFVFRHKDMHQLFTKKIRNWILIISTLGLLVYCFNNYVWNLPHLDFRPFKKGTDVTAQYNAEIDAMSSVQITGWKLENLNDGKVVELSSDVYYKELDKYPKTDWKVIDQIKTEPSVKKTKISDFTIDHIDGYEAYDAYLDNQGYRLMIVAHKMYADASTSEVTRIDTTYRNDTIRVEGSDLDLIRKIPKGKEVKEMVTTYDWDKDYLEKYTSKVVPFVQSALKDGATAGMVAGQSSPDMLRDFKKVIGMDIDYYTADDILLKTIIRSNPGIVLWKGGTIVDKWHISKLPEWPKVASLYGIN